MLLAPRLPGAPPLLLPGCPPSLFGADPPSSVERSWPFWPPHLLHAHGPLCPRPGVLETSRCLRGAYCWESGCCGEVNEDVRKDEGGDFCFLDVLAGEGFARKGHGSWASGTSFLEGEGGIQREGQGRGRLLSAFPPTDAPAQQAPGGSLWAPWSGSS